jgi:hypothetical protein
MSLTDHHKYLNREKWLDIYLFTNNYFSKIISKASA